MLGSDVSGTWALYTEGAGSTVFWGGGGCQGQT